MIAGLIAMLAVESRASSWDMARQEAGVVYFPQSTPPRLERFDLATETWLPALALPGNPTAFATDTDALFVACGLTLHRAALGSTNFTHLVSHTNAVTEIVVADDSLLFKSGNILGTVEKGSGLLRDMRLYGVDFSTLGYSTTTKSAFGLRSSVSWPPHSTYLSKIPIHPGGILTNELGGNLYTGTATNALLRVFPTGARLLTGSGRIIDTADLTESGALGGVLDDAAFNGDITAVLRGSNVTALTAFMEEAGTKGVAFLAKRIFATDQSVFVFGPVAQDGIAVAKISWTDLNAPLPGTPVDATRITYVPDQAVFGNGVVHLLSRQYRSIFRWDVASRSYLESIPLTDIPTNLVAAPTLNRLYAIYRSGKITRFNLTDEHPGETFFNHKYQGHSIALMAENDLVVSYEAPVVKTIALSPSGSIIAESGYAIGGPVQWNPIRRQLLAGSYQYLQSLPYQLNAFGGFGQPENRYIPFASFSGVAAVSDTGNLVLSVSGQVVDLSQYSLYANLGINVLSADWRADGLRTLRSIGAYAQVQHWIWNGNFQVFAGRQIEGQPVGMFRAGTNLLVVATREGQTQFHLLAEDLSVVHSSPLNPGPDNILISSSTIPRYLPSGTEIGQLSAIDSVTNVSHTFILLDSADGRFYVSGDRLMSSYDLTSNAGQDYFITVRARNSKGGSIDRVLKLSAIDGGATTISILVNESDVFEGESYHHAPRVILRRSGGSIAEQIVRLRIDGQATPDEDYYVYYDVSRLFPNEWRLRFPSGTNEISLQWYVQNDSRREPGETVEFSIVPENGAVFADQPPAQVTIWDSPYERWLSLRNGRQTSLADSAPGADPDGNSVPNFVEYRSGTPADPTNGYFRPQPVLDVDSTGKQRLSVLFKRNANQGDAERDFMVSSNLVDWSLTVPEEEILAVTNDVETVRWTVPAPDGISFFGHLRMGPIGSLRSPDFTVPGLGLAMVGLPNRPFQMGSPSHETGRYADEGPEFFASFTQRIWMSRHEITQAQYAALMSNNPSWNQSPSLPVDSVTWEEANLFCRRLTAHEAEAGRMPRGHAYRLPTEAEWENAARSSGTIWDGFPFHTPQESAPKYAWFSPNSSFHSHPVGEKQANPWGLHDLAGNVAEWCLDWYGAYPFNAAVDPKGPVSGLYRVVRGGSFIDGQTALRVAARNGGLPSQPSRFIGFRVVLGVALD